MRLFGDLGLVGMGSLAGAVVAWMRRFRRSGLFVFAAFAGMGLVGMLLSSLSGLAAYLYLCGAGIALERIIRNAPAGAPQTHPRLGSLALHGARRAGSCAT